MMNDVVRTVSVNEISRIYRTTESRYRLGLIGRAKWLLNEVSGDLRSAPNGHFNGCGHTRNHVFSCFP